MYIDHVKNIPQHELNAPVLSKVVKQVLVGPDQGWQGWVMRSFTLGEDGYSPRHSHPWPHINYIISGNGVLLLDGKERALEAGSVAYVPDSIDHQFLNKGSEDLVFICIVPEEGDK